ncbi:hypothetical protein TrVGV298_007711 [Trichoderma virens]|nr:hypothetical protein TrVGV298_007711 [Trichoderma virens]
MQQPVIPPRPSKSPAKDLLAATSTPLVPPRPTNKRIDRSKSPNPDRFAQSPFADGLISPLAAQFSPSDGNDGILDHHESVAMPSVGEEGLEYSVITSELQGEGTEDAEQTRSVAQDLKLHAPKPSLPASSAKERLMTVTRTDSDKAASFGIGKPGHLEGRSVSRNGLKKKSSTSFSTTSEQDHQLDDEHGIPEIGQRVPMNPHLGDVQAPSPAPTSDGNGKHHTRKHSSRGLPPGSYGMHGHGVESQDELDKAYYKKHPELLQREHHTPLHDRQNDFAMSSNDLNKLVRETAKRRSGIDFNEYEGTPHDEVAFQAHEEYASRMATPRPVSIVLDGGAPLEDPGASEDKPIHVDDPKHPEQYSYGAESPVETHGHDFEAPILAADEIEKDVQRPAQHPAIRPHLDRNSSSYDGTSRPTSRPSSRPTSIYNSLSLNDFDHTPLEDVREYEPLFPDEAAKKEEEEKRQSKDGSKARHYFPSKDVWEDAPTSVHYTAEVSTPDNAEEETEEDQQRRKSSAHHENRPMTPAQMFALQQEQLAEKEANGKKHNFLPILEHKPPSWVDHQPHLKTGKPNRFPSKDVWEDAPESLMYEAEVEEKPKDEKKPEVPARPSKKLTELLSHKPAVPERPKSRPQVGAASEDAAKPVIPIRPVKKASGDSKDGDAPKPKPPVPSRPAGGKIAALQAGFMSDLNKRLQLGPQPSKKEEAEKPEPAEEKEKVPLSDARKSRARGPQRRAPTQSSAPAPAAAATKEATPASLSISLPQTIWNIDPEHGGVHVASDSLEPPSKEASETVVESEKLLPQPTENEKPAESEKPKAEEEKEPEPPVQPVESEVPKESAEPAASETVLAPEPVVPEPVAEPEETKVLESAKEPEKVEEPEETKETAEPEKPEEIAKSDEPVKEETIAANTAGESILEAKVEQKGDEIEPVEVKDEVKA